LGHTRLFPTVSPAHTVVRWGGTICLRLHSAGSTMPHLGPTGSSVGWLPSITTRWFSASPSDPTSRWAPCPPESCARRLQVPLGCVPLSRSCPCRVLHTCLALPPPGAVFPPPLDSDPWPRAGRDFNPPEPRAARHALRRLRPPAHTLAFSGPTAVG